MLSVASCGRSTEQAADAPTIQDFRLETLDHERFYMSEQRGKVVVLMFWATWCTSCKKELTELAPFFDSFVSDALAVAAVNTDPENRDKVNEILEQLGIGYTILLDREAGLLSKLGFDAVPATVIIDREGGIRYRKTGYSPSIKRQIEVTLASLLG